MKPTQLHLLVHLARKGGVHLAVPTSTVELAKEVGLSQQTVSRWVVQLERDGLVQRAAGPRGQKILVTNTGLDVLLDLFGQLEPIFGEAAQVTIRGRVATGEGEGAWYVGLSHYRKAFATLLGWEPFPGTLNLELGGDDLRVKEVLRRRPGLEIEPFRTAERTFGGVTCFPATVRGEAAAVIFPHRTRHATVLEVVSPRALRDALKLRDGDELPVMIDARPERRVDRPA